MMRAMVVAFAVGCGGGSDPPMMMMAIDAAPDAGCGMLPCNPILTASCTNGQRCTWRVDDQLPEKGVLACKASGAIAQGLPCTRDAGGGDNCVRGATCYQDKCRAICGLGGGAPVCDVGLTCSATTYLIPCGSTMPLAGLCL